MFALEKLSLFEEIIEFLSFEMKKTPTIYGWFHLLSLFVFIIITFVCIIKLKKSTEQEMNRFLRTTAIVMLLFEVYKQFVFTIEGSTWDYQWYAFPFQFCSVPMYVMLIASFLKKGFAREALLAFLGTYSLFAGLAVMIYPETVFIDTLGISIQTMVHHGLMITVGLVLITSGHIKLQRNQIYKAACVFFILAATAFILNIVFYRVGETFNMFFIGPYYDTTLPVLSLIEAKLGYIPFLFSYFLGFTLAAYLVLLTAIKISKKHLSGVNSKLLKDSKAYK